MTLLGSYQGLWVECFGVPQLRPNWSIQTKSRVWVNSKGRVEVLSKGHIKGKPKDVGRLQSKGLLGSHFQNLYLLVTQRAVISSITLYDRVSVSLRLLGDYWPKRMDAKAAILRSSSTSQRPKNGISTGTDLFSFCVFYYDAFLEDYQDN